jgi:hypothetical protein
LIVGGGIGFIDSLKESAKKSAQAIGTGAKTLSTNIANELKRRQAYSNAQRRILSKFEMPQLKGICKAYGIGEPSPYEEDYNGKKHKIKLTRVHYENYAVNHLSLNQINDFAEKNRMQVWNIMDDYKKEIATIEGKSYTSAVVAAPVAGVALAESHPAQQKTTEPTMPSSEDDEFKTLLKVIQTHFRPEPVRDEKELEGQLSIWLQAKYPNSVRRQIQTGFGKVDLVLFGKYAIELKIATNRNVLRDMEGQLKDYKKAYPRIATVIMDPRKIDRSIIEDYRREYANDGIESIIIEGGMRTGKTPKGFTVNISR